MESKKARKALNLFLEKLEAIRKESNLSFDNLSQITSLSKSTLNEIANKKSSPELLTCLRICHALDIKLSDLLREIGE